MADNCKDILMTGVYEHHIHNKTGNIEQDYKHYFSSEEFKKDFKNSEFKFGVEAIIDAVPAKLNFGATDNEIAEFQKLVNESTTFSLKQSFFEQSVHSIPNKAVVEAWQACMGEKLGFKITNEVIGNSVIFKLRYINFGLANLPTLQGISVTGGILVSRSKQDEEKININEELVVVCTFLDESILITIDTDFTAITDSADKNVKGKSKDNNPIGTVICSYLNWEEFQKITENNKYTTNGLWNSEFSFWAPCDGREIDKSDLHKVTDKSVPDLRGVFLRGLNSFDRYENDNGIPSVSDLQKDPEPNRIRASFQKDDVEAHTHAFQGRNSGAYRSGELGQSANLGDSNERTSSHGGSETRPKNVALYYYIKIN